MAKIIMKKTVFITGATGNMGWAGFQELHARADRFNIRLLARDSKKNRKQLKPYLDDPSVEIVWGDLMSYDDVLKGVTGSDYVLHVGGMVSPAADYYPEKTLKVNVGSAENVVKAVLAQPNASDIKVVYIGSVAQYGDRNPPCHWGSADDPQTPAKFDMYALSKIRSEEIFAKSGLKNWVSLRQSGILYPGIL
jgi:nucleoside-diphosphate-sugar epimerase